ncbi:hypothetical protein EDC01DRAFT_617584 [Geopyxis carbonaria]|nr:hypothetical protein EDC01DRAFT_617584 [Geopyxis carbonaria]
MVDIQLDQSEQTNPDHDFDHSALIDSTTQGPFFGYDRRKNAAHIEEGDEDDDSHEPPDDITVEMLAEESSPFQKFQRQPRSSSPSLPFAAQSQDEEISREETPFIQRESNPARIQPGIHSANPQIPQQVYHPTLEPPTHDHIWGTLYILSMSCLLATSFVVWLRTEEPKNLKPVDSIYNLLHSSIHLLAVDTFVAIAVALTWMYLLRSFVRPLIYGILFSVPVILVAFSIYPFVMSFKTGEKVYGAQDRAMRWGSFIPAIIAVSWVYTAWKGRNALHRAIGIIQLVCRILGDNPALILLSFGTLLVTCAMTWTWFGMFTRSFLTGSMFIGKGTWVWSLNKKNIALGVYYIIMYLWTLGILSGIHRATSSASVSQWYFHRHVVPTPSSKQVSSAAFNHSTSTLFGTICFHAFAALLVRLPLVIAPRRVVGIIHLFMFQFISSPIAALINPLTLTYAAIHSQPLRTSSRAIANLKFVDTAGFGPTHHPRAAYRLSKMLLTAARGVTALTLGVGAWVAAARNVNDGSVYGYVVGLIAGSIGWAILGATEGCLSNIVDATLVCVGSEDGVGTHCREAQLVFGG